MFKESSTEIVNKWISSKTLTKVFVQHNIDSHYFTTTYAIGVFDYFMAIIEGNAVIGDCPVMGNFLEFLKDKEIRSEELFIICSHFRKAMIDFTYDNEINSKELFDEISYLYDENFFGLLRRYTDTIYEKEQEVKKTMKLLVDAKQEAIDAGVAKEFFLSHMSHEIRTPLNAILGFVGILKDGKNSKKHQRYLNIIEKSGSSLLQILNNILDFSKLQNSEFTIHHDKFNIHEELSNTLELFSANARERSITLQSFIDPNIPYEIIIDGLRLKQILSNFLSNALKFSFDGCDIDVKILLKEKNLIISVEDSGIGLTKKEQKTIFDSFYQVHNVEESQKNIEGTGLGLNISWRLAQLMDGEISVSSKPKKGSCFTLQVPIKFSENSKTNNYNVTLFKKLKIALLQSSSEVNDKVHSIRSYWKSFNLDILDTYKLDEEAYDLLFFVDSMIDNDMRESLKKHRMPCIAIMNDLEDTYDNYSHITALHFPIYCSKLYQSFLDALHLNPSYDRGIIHGEKVQRYFDGHILVAEDNEANKELIKILLERYGLSCYIANDGAEALAIYKVINFDLVLMDEEMPNMCGSASAKEMIKYDKVQKREATPIVGLSANVVDFMKHDDIIKNSVYNSFLSKPIILKELEEILNQFTQEQFLAQNRSSGKKNISKKDGKNSLKIEGVNIELLMSELMLEENEVTILIEAYISKMRESLALLFESIINKNYKLISKEAHTIKGSSANFRLHNIESIASEIESLSKSKTASDYKKLFTLLEIEVLKIKFIS